MEQQISPPKKKSINKHLFKKEGNPATCYNKDEPWGYYAKWNKPVTKGQIVYDSIYMKSPE